MMGNRIYYFYALYSVLAWSLLSLITDNLSEVPVFLSLSIAFFTSSLLSLHKWRRWSLHLPTITIGFAGIFGFHALFFFALHSSPPIEATMLVDLWPMMIILFTPLILPEFKLHKNHYIAVVFGLSGSCLIVTNGGQFSFHLEYLAGYGLAVLAGIFWAGYTLATKALPDFDTANVGLFCLLAAIASFIVHVLVEPAVTPEPGDYAWMVLLGLGPLGSAFYTWDRALKLGDTRVIGALSFLIPMLSALWLILFGNHTLTPVAGIAMILILLGLIAGSMKKSKKIQSDT